jgi:hypothetical protein
VSRYECEDCSLAAMDLPDGVDPEFVFEVCEFPPEANDGPAPDGHHAVTGECFACMVGVATGPESHGDRCPLATVQSEAGQ